MFRIAITTILLTLVNGADAVDANLLFNGDFSDPGKRDHGP